MKIDFGVVKIYFETKGFGFVSHTFLNTNTNSNEVFFHIKNIKSEHPELAERLKHINSTETICFWYKIEESKKGEAVSSILTGKSIQQKSITDLSIYIEEITQVWRDINFKLPDWINQVTIDLVGFNGAYELLAERESLVFQRNEKKEKLRVAKEKLQADKKKLQRKKDDQIKKLRKQEREQQNIEDNEFKKLITEIRPLGLVSSKQLTSYIMKNNLGRKYENISGILELELEGRKWDYNGGFPNKIYTKICRELKLRNEGSKATVVGFKSYKQLGK